MPQHDFSAQINHDHQEVARYLTDFRFYLKEIDPDVALIKLFSPSPVTQTSFFREIRIAWVIPFPLNVEMETNASPVTGQQSFAFKHTFSCPVFTGSTTFEVTSDGSGGTNFSGTVEWNLRAWLRLINSATGDHLGNTIDEYVKSQAKLRARLLKETIEADSGRVSTLAGQVNPFPPA